MSEVSINLKDLMDCRRINLVDASTGNILVANAQATYAETQQPHQQMVRLGPYKLLISLEAPLC